MGVSALKCFETQSRYLANATLTAMDVEDPNWVRARHWGAYKVEESQPSLGLRNRSNVPSTSLSVAPLACASATPLDRTLRFPVSNRGNRLFYLEADVMQSANWKRLASIRSRNALPPFNLILSDALHTGGGLEMEMSEPAHPATALENPAAPPCDAVGRGNEVGSRVSVSAAALLCKDGCEPSHGYQAATCSVIRAVKRCVERTCAQDTCSISS
eukprot:6338230-Prymnesium_polylepis.1